jgi:hypothetical protein
MTGGLMQLVAYGAQDIYLTGSPIVTYFKSVYRRHTNFAMESIEQTFNGTVAFGSKVSALISRSGDLVNGACVEVTLPALTNTGSRWTDDVGHHLLSEVTVEVGGQQIDKHTNDWLEVWAQLTVPASKKQGYREMIGQDPRHLAIGADLDNAPGLQDVAASNSLNSRGARLDANGNRKLFVPLQFWFCRNVGLSLPLIALQYHEVKVNVLFNSLSNLTTDAGNGVGALSASLWVDYIFLDTDERRRFAQVSHEYLIEQLQVQEDSYTAGATTKSVVLNFNHPVKELIWVCQQTPTQLSNYTTKAADAEGWYTRPGGILEASAGGGVTNANYRANVAENPTQSAKLKLNGQDRMASRDGSYFNLYQTIRHHTSCPDSPGINVFSFAIKPEEHQPSGTCNFSRIDNASLLLSLNPSGQSAGTVKVFAPNYNVFRVMSGMAGNAYSN